MIRSYDVTNSARSMQPTTQDIRNQNHLHHSSEFGVFFSKLNVGVPHIKEILGALGILTDKMLLSSHSPKEK